MPQMDQDALAEILALQEAGDYQNPRFMDLLYEPGGCPPGSSCSAPRAATWPCTTTSRRTSPG
jgi:hypothetical protein